MKRVIDNYNKVMQTLKILTKDKSVRGDARTRIAGFLKKGNQAEMYVKIAACYEIFKSCEQVAKVLQGVGVTASGALKNVTVLQHELHLLRCDGVFRSKVQSAAKYAIDVLILKQPKERRITKPSGRLTQSG